MKVIITPKAQKHYAKLPKQEQRKVKHKISTLETNPLAGKKLEGEFKEARSLRAWPYRILYMISSKEQTIYIVSILHRQGAYK